ncbi:TlpA disulfide reductase family protein [Sulfurimonas sp.]|uniref:TlpA family protein disulfide reductase n=1 Tax=Sulfurimonas sp. TaxID=2022749 RepID=UPI0026387247|nr:TlpA disulfide reductase family protein [Sulfurimonas sp.]
MSKFSLLSTLLAASLMFQACSDNNKDTAQDVNSILSTNEFVLTGLDNKQYIIEKAPQGFKLKNMQGKVLILDIFATWCPPCQAEASHLASLQKKYKDDLVIIGITVENNIPNTKLKNFRELHGADYVLVNSTENTRIIDAVAEKLHLGRDFGIPLMAMYKDGKLVNYYQGATEEEFIQSDIKKALGK